MRITTSDLNKNRCLEKLRVEGHVAEKKLDLVQLSASQVAQTGAGSPQIVRCELVNAGASRRGGDNIPEHFG